MIRPRSGISKAGAVLALIFLTGLSPVAADQHIKPAPESRADAAAEALATYTEALAWFTGLLALVGVGQGVLIWQQFRLARAEFISTHRPRLRVRSFNANLVEGQPIRLSYTVVNVGDTPAHITTHNVIVSVKEMPRLGHKTFSKDRSEAMSTQVETVQAGASYECLTGEDQDLKFNPNWNLGVAGGHLTIQGKIEYRDDNGVIRRTAFFRSCGPGGGFINSIDGSDLEYED